MIRGLHGLAIEALNPTQALAHKLRTLLELELRDWLRTHVEGFAAVIQLPPECSTRVARHSHTSLHTAVFGVAFAAFGVIAAVGLCRDDAWHSKEKDQKREDISGMHSSWNCAVSHGSRRETLSGSSRATGTIR